MRSGIWLVPLLVAACGRLGFDDTATAPTGGSGGGGGGSVPLGPVTSLAPVTSLEIGTHVHRLLVSGSILYVATMRPGAELAVFDIRDPANPIELGSAPTAGTPYDLALAGTHLYVTTETGGDDLEIFDVANPGAPQKLGGVAAADTAYRVAVQDGRAYVTSAAGGDDLEIFDVTNPRAIQKLGGLDLLPSYYVRGVSIAYPLAYTAGQRMSVIDVSDPAAPVVLGDGGFYWYAYDLVVAGTRAIGLDSNNGNQPQLRVWDVTDPTAPALLGMASIWDSYGRDVELAGSYALTVCAPGGYSSGAELEVWDVSGAAAPVRVTSAHLEHDGYAVAVSGKHIFVGEMESADAELRVFEAR